MAITRADFPLPDLTDERTAPFFEGAARGELVVPRCDTCASLTWYPMTTCDRCGATSFAWTPVSGRGGLFSWTVVERAFLPAFEDRVPFVSGLVALEDDPRVRIVSYVVDCDPAALTVDQPVVASFRPLRFATVPDREVVVPMFVPQDQQSRGQGG